MQHHVATKQVATSLPTAEIIVVAGRLNNTLYTQTIALAAAAHQTDQPTSKNT